MADPRKNARGFTLIELLMVIALIAGLATFLMGNLTGGQQSAALESAQATLGNLLVAARTKALANARGARILIHNDVGSPERLRRYLALQELDSTNNWVTLSDALLPAGAYVLPYQTHVPSGMLENDTLWKKVDNSTVMHSSVLSSNVISAQVNSAVAESWEILAYGARGTSATSGLLVLASGRLRPPGTYAAAKSPLRLENQENVRGVSISSYGMVTYLNGRAAF